MTAEMLTAVCALLATAGALLAGVWRASQITAHLDQAREEIAELKAAVNRLADKLQAQEIWFASMGFRRGEVTNPGIRR